MHNLNTAPIYPLATDSNELSSNQLHDISAKSWKEFVSLFNESQAGRRLLDESDFDYWQRTGDYRKNTHDQSHQYIHVSDGPRRRSEVDEFHSQD